MNWYSNNSYTGIVLVACNPTALQPGLGEVHQGRHLLPAGHQVLPLQPGNMVHKIRYSLLSTGLYLARVEACSWLSMRPLLSIASTPTARRLQNSPHCREVTCSSTLQHCTLCTALLPGGAGRDPLRTGIWSGGQLPPPPSPPSALRWPGWR